WPNVLTTVAEFNEASINHAIGQMWGNLFFFLALLGIVILIYKNFRNMAKNFIISLLSIAILYYLVTQKGTGLELAYYLALLGIAFSLALYSAFKSEEEIDIKLAVLFFLWIAASIYAATKGVRFVLLLAPPVAIGIGITFGFLHRTLSSTIAKLTKANKVFVAVMLFLVFSYYIIGPVKEGVNTAKNYLPNVNDRWWSALTKIKENSKPDAIINSWWDFGHWFKYIADRRVTLDGSSQNNHQLYWLGKLLLTPNEKEAVGILRMLDCGGNRAFDTIKKVTNNNPKSIELLNRLSLIQDGGQAKGILINEGFSKEESEKIVNYTHCEPPENFLITSEDMIGKSGVWAHFGSWDFDRAWMERAFRNNDDEAKVLQMFMDEFNYSKETATGYYSEIRELKSDSEVNAWIAPWPSYISQESCESVSNIVRCPFQQGFVEIDLGSMDASIPTSGGIKKPAVFSYTSPSGINVREYNDNAINLGMVLLINKDGSYSSIYMAPQLTNSTFTKLFYLDGHGTSYFDLFHESGGPSTDIIIWKVNWEGSKKPRIVERFDVQASS
ncbi:MAG: STT3 domain-containing protein, partial [Nanoarchaeota archaeon]